MTSNTSLQIKFLTNRIITMHICDTLQIIDLKNLIMNQENLKTNTFKLFFNKTEIINTDYIHNYKNNILTLIPGSVCYDKCDL